MAMIEGMKRVSVAVRVRPVLRTGVSHTHQQEKFELEAITRMSDTQVKVEQKKQDEACRSSIFTFDYIFDQESTQLEVYEESVVDLVDAALIGANATILAYGQTGSGKTHSVLGEVKPNPLENDLLTSNSGLFLRVLQDLMEYKRRRANEMHVVVGLSCVEIYNENIRDLFGGSPNDQPPALRAVMIGDDVYLPSLIVKEVTSLQAVFAEIQLAISRRQSRSTEMNATSSRSHCLFMIDILQCAISAPKPLLSLIEEAQKNGGSTGPQDGKVGRVRSQTIVDSKDDGKTPRPRGQTMVGTPASGTPPCASPTTPSGEVPFIGTIYRVPGQTEAVWGSKILLADLAGSEKIKNSGVVGEGLAEATSINSSLTALGNVVHSLHEGSYVSYRTSNLTRLFKPTFSHPASRVLLLAQVSPTQLTFDETISTLHFANKVKAMKVTTTTGAEAEKLQFEVIEAEKTFDSLSADLHIFTAETGCRPIIHRTIAKKSAAPQFFYEAKSKRPYKAAERKAFLEHSGLFEIAEDEKRKAVQRRIDEEAQLQKHCEASFVKQRDETVNAYKDQRSELVVGLQKHRSECTDHLIKQLILDSSAAQAILSVEEEIDMLAIEAQYCDERKNITRAALAHSDDHLHTLASSNTLKKQPSINHHVDAQHMDQQADILKDDEAYALSCWGQCAAKRFFCSIAELREAQYRYSLAKTQSASLGVWLEKAEAASRQQVHHHGSHTKH